LRKQKNVEVLMTEMTRVNTQNRIVHMHDADLPYDYLVLATGIHYNYFGNEERKRLAPGLDSVDDADRIRSKILMAFEVAERLAT
jgi:NADH:quinone reductase (non-electrogenic)